MNILLIGSGGREHALAWKMRQSPLLDKLFIAPGNGGTGAVGENVVMDVTDHAAAVDFCRLMAVQLVVVGPEAPLVDGLADTLRAAGVATFGPSKSAAQLEGSKAFTKVLCDEMGIPTAAYERFSERKAALAYIRAEGAPIVIKADGLAAGKGVTVAMTLAEAETAIEDCFSGAFGSAGAEVVIEEFMEGEEASVFAICDGERFVTLATAQDHKRAFDGDEGPNTGGMGAYSPAPVMTSELLARAETEILGPTVKGMAERGTPFQGVLYAGLILTDEGPKLIEYNARFGDPETQVLMLRMQSDLVPLLLASAAGDLSGVDVRWSQDVALTVVMAANGYPGDYEKGSSIGGLDKDFGDYVEVFHAGTALRGDQVTANGGRVLNVTARGATVAEAHLRAYAAIQQIDWPDGFCRSDIGWRAINREKGAD